MLTPTSLPSDVTWLLSAVALVLGGGFALAALLGAPYLPVRRQDEESLLDLADLKPGDKLVDLGAGDGRLLRAAAKREVYGTGYEINLLLYLWSLVMCWRYRKYIQLRLGNYWNAMLPQADAIYVFLIDHYMAKLDQKLKREVTRPTKVVSYVFRIPGKKPQKTTKNAFLYLYP
ncbi:MAG TPA: hypothetical protein VNA68_00250 [Candidatus Dormibacteraeota bacterium]|nr:hypothetical protein [Candidatus Dormibacteraeota bacterium]